MDSSNFSFRYLNYGWFALCLALCPGAAKAESIDFDFKSADLFDHANSTGLWNTVTGRVEAPMASGGAIGKEIDFGGGSDGPFLDGANVAGITQSGSTITINTDLKSDFQFSSFTLSSGQTVQVSGSKPLHIRVLGATSVAGTIHLDGLTGQGNAGPSQATGGSGLVGGANGGLGGVSTLSASTPIATAGSFSAPAQGGAHGNYNTTGGGDQGGGGGCTGSGAGALDATAALGGGAGTAGVCGTYAVNANGFESSFSGGGGGGGGGGTHVGSDAYNGGAGGGGGGAIHITSLGTFNLSGSITAKGGNGGNYNAGNGATGECGGGGGGGSGGSVWIQSGTSVASSGVVDLTAGAGGTSSTGFCVGNYDGGHGSKGILRVDTPSGTITSTPAGTLTNSTSIASPQTYAIYSKPIDFSTKYVDFSTPVESFGCGSGGTVAVTYEASADGANFAHSTDKTSLKDLSDYPYIRVKALIATTSATPPCLTALSIPYSPRELNQLKLKGGLACATVSTKRGGPKGGAGLAGALELSAFFLIAFAATRKRMPAI